MAKRTDAINLTGITSLMNKQKVKPGLDLEKCGIVRADQAVEAKAGLLNAQRGVPRGWGADWQDLAWGMGAAPN